MTARLTRALTKTASFNAKLSLRVVFMTALDDETALYTDAAYSSKESHDRLESFSIADQTQRKSYRNKRCWQKIGAE